MKDEAQELAAVIETTMQVIIALRWAAQRGDALPESLDVASQRLLNELYDLQGRRTLEGPACSNGFRHPVGGRSTPVANLENGAYA